MGSGTTALYKSYLLGQISEPEIAKEIGSRVMAFNDGDYVEGIEQGELIEAPDEKSRDVIKIVEDARVIADLRDSSEETVMAFMGLMADSAIKKELGHSFEDEAQNLLDEEAYCGLSAQAVVPLEPGVVANVRRRVLYVRRNQKTGLLMAVESDEVKNAADGQPAITLPLPRKLRVGSSYINRAEGSYNKVVAASILEPSGVIWTHSNKGGNARSRKKQKHGLLDLKPKVV